MFHDRETWQHLKKSRASRTPERHAKQGRRPFFFSFSLLSGFTITSTSSSLLSKSREGGRSYRQETQSRFCTPPPPSPTQKKTRRQSTYKTEGPCQDWMCHHLANTHTHTGPKTQSVYFDSPNLSGREVMIGPGRPAKGARHFLSLFHGRADNPIKHSAVGRLS